MIRQQMPCALLTAVADRRRAASRPPAPRPGGAPRASTARTSSRLAAAAAGAGLEHRLDHAPTMSRKPIRPARNAATAISLAALSTVGAVPPARSASRGEASAGKRSWSGASKVSRPIAAEVEPRGRRADPLRPAQRVGDRDAHVRLAELGQHRAVAERDQAVHDRFRMDQDLDLLLRQAEQVMGLDQLEALVHHGGANRPRSWRPCTSWDGRPPGSA